MRKKFIIYFGDDHSSSVQINGRNKNTLVLDAGTTQGLDNATITAEPRLPIIFTESGKRFVLSLHYNGSNSFLFVNAVKIYQFKVKDSEIKPYPSCLGNISKDFTIDNIKKTDLKENVQFFC